jgi:hypothetical protein
MFFPVPDFGPIVTAIEFLFWGGTFAAAFAAGYIVGGIWRR